MAAVREGVNRTVDNEQKNVWGGRLKSEGELGGSNNATTATDQRVIEGKTESIRHVEWKWMARAEKKAARRENSSCFHSHRCILEAVRNDKRQGVGQWPSGQ